MGPIHKEIQREKQDKMLQDLLGKDHLKAVDKWIARQNDLAIDRPEAIRRLVDSGLRRSPRADCGKKVIPCPLNSGTIEKRGLKDFI
jgi:hypothetical protein